MERLTFVVTSEFYTDSVPSAPRSTILIASLYILADVDL